MKPHRATAELREYVDALTKAYPELTEDEVIEDAAFVYLSRRRLFKLALRLLKLAIFG